MASMETVLIIVFLPMLVGERGDGAAVLTLMVSAAYSDHVIRRRRLLFSNLCVHVGIGVIVSRAVILRFEAYFLTIDLG